MSEHVQKEDSTKGTNFIITHLKHIKQINRVQLEHSPQTLHGIPNQTQLRFPKAITAHGLLLLQHGKIIPKIGN
jgi:hypothetical protein